MKVSFKTCVLRHQQRKDKTFPVNIRIGFKSKYVFFQTDYDVSKHDTKGLSVKNSEINDKCNILISQYREIVKRIPDIDSHEVSDIATFIKRKLTIEEDIDFIKFLKKHIVKQEEVESSQIAIYKATYNHLQKFTQSDSLPISRITYKFLTDFENYLSKRDVKSRGINLYLSKIRAIYNIIIDEYEELGYTFKYPFRKYKLPLVKPPKTIALTKEQLMEIINVNLGNKVRANRARYAFIISLFTLGTNASDLYDLNSIHNDRIEYNRNKTKTRRTDNAFISIKIESEMKPYLEKLKGSNGFVFCFREWYKNKPQFNKGINKGLEQVVKIINDNYRKKLVEKLKQQNESSDEIKKMTEKNFIHNFDFYDARRTMASVMRNKLGISKDDIALCLNHKDMAHKTTDYYIEVDFSILDKCNRKFIDWLFS